MYTSLCIITSSSAYKIIPTSDTHDNFAAAYRFLCSHDIIYLCFSNSANLGRGIFFLVESFNVRFNLGRTLLSPATLPFEFYPEIILNQFAS